MLKASKYHLVGDGALDVPPKSSRHKSYTVGEWLAPPVYIPKDLFSHRRGPASTSRLASLSREVARLRDGGSIYLNTERKFKIVGASIARPKQKKGYPTLGAFVKT